MSDDDFAVTTCTCTLVRESSAFFLVLLTHAIFSVELFEIKIKVKLMAAQSN